MQIAISRRKLILLVLIIVAAIIAIALALRPARGEEPDTQSQEPVEAGAPFTEDWVRQREQALAGAPEEMVMSDGVPAVRGRATFTGFGEGNQMAFVTVKLDSGKEYNFAIEVGKASIFRSEDVFSRFNQPSPTVENPTAVLQSFKDTPVFLRYTPGDPPTVRSIIIGGNQ
ncbi:MAG: hypothetical protein J7575_08100 [Chloroflexi bacterium]|nr:hypothetical protein [Chloroflexota bacterium]